MRLFSKKDGRTFFQDLHKIKAEIDEAVSKINQKDKPENFI